MKTTKIKSKTLYIYAGIIIIAGLIYWFYFKKDKSQEDDTSSSGSGSGSESSGNSVIPETEGKLFKEQPVEPSPTPRIEPEEKYKIQPAPAPAANNDYTDFGIPKELQLPLKYIPKTKVVREELQKKRELQKKLELQKSETPFMSSTNYTDKMFAKSLN